MLLIEYYLNFRDKIESLNTFDEIGGFMFQYMGEMTINVNKLKDELSDTKNKLSAAENRCTDIENKLKQRDSTLKNVILTLFKDGYSVERVAEKFSVPLANVLEIHEEYLLSVN